VYRVEPLFDKASREELAGAGESFVEGQVDTHLIISVPVTTSEASIARIRDTVQHTFNRPCLVITHNMQFLKTQKLAPKEASKIIKDAEDYAEKRSRDIEEARLVAFQEINHNGDRSGVSEHGDSGVAEGPDGENNLLDGHDGNNEKS